MTERLLNAEPSAPDDRDFLFAGDTAAPLPSRWFATGLGPRLDQGNTGTCVAHAATGMRQWQENRDHNGFIPVDIFRLYDLIKNVVDKRPDPGRTMGTTIRSALRFLTGTGTPLRGERAPGAGGKLLTYWRVWGGETAIKQALMKHGPVMVRCDWDANWMRLPLNRILRPPLGRTVGGHAFIFYGWDDNVNEGSWLMRNSWGRWSIGGSGNAYLNYRYFAAHRPEAWASTDVIGD